jgi:hypothetical protein
VSQCPRPGCKREVPPDLFACTPDWFSIPKPLRDQIWRTWRRRLAAMYTPGYVDAAAAHEAAKQEAIASWQEPLELPL